MFALLPGVKAAFACTIALVIYWLVSEGATHSVSALANLSSVAGVSSL